MKPMSAVKNTFLACSLAAALLGSASVAGAADAEPVVQTAGSVSYVSGGVGSESIDRLSALSSQFNVKLVFAINSGEYVSDVGVVISDGKGRKVVDAVSEGPWFLVRLPAGNYQIVATLAGKAEKRQVVVGATKLMTMDFRWSAN